MRSSLNPLSSRIGILACGLAIVAAACGGGSSGKGGTGGARTDGGDAAMDSGQGGARVDAGTGGAPMDAGAGGRMDGGAGGAAMDAGVGGSGAGGSQLSLPWHAFLPLGMAAPGSSLATGTTLDLTSNHYDATYFGTTISFANGSLNLTGLGAELVVVPARAGVPAVDVTGSYSVSAWVTLANVAGYRTVVAGEGVNIASFFLQKRADTGAWAYTVSTADSITAPGCITPGPQTDGGPVQSPVLPIAGTQYHLVATRDATTNLHVLYVNGVESGRNTCVAGWADTGILGIGHGVFAGNRGDNVQGSIAEVGVINRVLTSAEVADLFARGRAVSSTPDAGADTGAGDTGADTGAGDTGASADAPAATDAANPDAAADMAAGG